MRSKQKRVLVMLGMAGMVAGLAVGVRLVLKPTSIRTQAQQSVVTFSFDPSQATFSGERTFTLKMDTVTSRAAFVRVETTFEKAKIKFNEIATVSGSFSRVIKKSTVNEANTSGSVVLVIAVSPGVSVPSGVIDLARFSIATNSATLNSSTELSVVLTSSQVVDEVAVALPITANKLKLTLNPSVPVSSPTSTPNPTGTPIPTSTPLPTVTPTGGIPSPTPGQITVSLQVNAATDDGYDVSGSSTFNTSLSGTNGALVLGGKMMQATATTGLRFNNVTIPQGKQIVSAKLNFAESWGGDYGSNVKNRIYAEKVANCPAFGGSSLPRNRIKTAAYVDWNSNGSQGSTGQWYQISANSKPPEMKAVIQEVVNQSTWVSGNSVCVLVTDNGSTTDWWFEPRGYEAGVTYAPKLVVTYL